MVIHLLFFFNYATVIYTTYIFNVSDYILLSIFYRIDTDDYVIIIHFKLVYMIRLKCFYLD